MTDPILNSIGFMVGNDLLNCLLGKKIGEGSFRAAYAMEDNPDRVVKIETGLTYYNTLEWEIWTDCPAAQRKWLAPCFRISPCGTCLIQARVTPVKHRPARIPNWLDDNKLENWGRYKGRIVCCDYGHHRFFKNGFKRTRLINGRNLWRTPPRDF